MPEPIERDYFNWLCEKVLDKGSNDYRSLMEILYRTEFIWVVHADKHRLDDGLELREDFLRDMQLPNVLEDFPCSIFEMLIAFADRASFQTDRPLKDWFWEFLANLQLDNFRNISRSNLPIIEDLLYTFTWRTYKPNGFGGLFPLNQTNNDQREVELWYQMCEYFDDRGLF